LAHPGKRKGKRKKKGKKRDVSMRGPDDRRKVRHEAIAGPSPQNEALVSLARRRAIFQKRLRLCKR
jgi:hypothetical protein